MMTSSEALPHVLDRTILIAADREVVFRFFTDTGRWAAWWGAGSSIEPQPGGRVLIRYPGGTEVVGEVVEIAPPERLVFTYGYSTGAPVAIGASLVTIALERHRTGTRLHLSHAFADAAARDEHVQGWRYQLSLFANAVANDLHGSPAALVDQWFAAWSQPDNAARAKSLPAIVTGEVAMRDQFSAVDGLADLAAHLDAVHRFMPGVTIRRDGHAQHCQGTVIADWIASLADGTERARGTNVFTLSADRRIASVTGFWRAPQAAQPKAQSSRFASRWPWRRRARPRRSARTG